MSKLPVYRDPAKPVAARVKDLLKRMTLEEKAGQLISTCPVSQLKLADYSEEQVVANGKKLIDRGIGQLGVAARHPTPALGPKVVNALQRYARENTRLGIPVLVQDECVHGCKANGSTMFPMSIGMAATWNPDLLERMTDAVGKEVQARGINQCFSPTLNLGRDVRCGRTEETYGEDPYLAGRMGVAFIKTLQKHDVIATPKHFAANFVGDGGRDSHAVHFSERLLREIYFPAFRAAVEEAGAMSVMIAHTAIDGIPCSNNSWLMNDILRKEWGFDGFIVPDNTDVQKNFAVHSQADSYEQSAKWCLEAGLDTDLSWPPPDPRLCYLDHLPKLVRSGKVKQKFLDESVARILAAKFKLGLFDNPYLDEKLAAKITQCPKHRQLALETALESMVLLKNDGVLPLPAKARTLAVIGPSAEKPRLGGYTCENPRSVSPVDGIRALAPKNTQVIFAEGCKLALPDRSGFAAAVQAAKKADLVLMFMGNSSDKVVGQPETTEGERHDRCNLDLPGVQEDLILEVAKANPNIVVVLQGGSAVTMKRWIGSARAILEAWYPGAECGNAIARVLFGHYNPAGRLPITFPATTGMCPLYYNPRPHGRAPDYQDHRGRLEQFAFGHGLSYTTFDYRDLKVRVKGRGRQVAATVTCTVANTGTRDGDDVVQLYLRDLYSSITRPILELRGFKRIHLKAGAAAKVAFTLGFDDFSFLGRDLKPVLEPGNFKIMIGASSADLKLEKIITL